MVSDWDKYADGWNDNEDVVQYAGYAFKSLREVTNVKGLNILDFGCGTGNLTELMAKTADRVVGVDISPRMISVLKSKNIPNIDALAIDIMQENLKTIPAFSRKFDLITASSVMAFVDDFQGILETLKPLLAPNGTIVQWDWLGEEGTEVGFGSDQLVSAYVRAGYNEFKITLPFEITSDQGSMKVIMAMGKN